MKPKIITAILLFISAYSPLFLILAVKDFRFKHPYGFDNPILISVLIGISILSVILLFYTMNNMKRGNMPIQVKEIKNRSIDLINYTIPYIISFVGLSLSDINDIISLLIFLFLLLLLTLKSKSVFINPLLLMIGYNLYDVEYEFNGKLFSNIFLSKVEIKKNETFYVRSLTRFLYVVIEKK